MLSTISWLIIPGFFYAIYRQVKKRDKIHWLIPPLLLFLTSATFAAGPAGRWVMDLVAKVLGGMGLAVGLVSSLAIILLVLGIVLDLRDKKADRFARTALVLVPLVAILAAGPIAEAVNGITNGVSDTGNAAVTRLTN